MSRHIEARFQIASWDETLIEDGDDATKLTEALVSKRYEGDIKGTSTTKWLLAYAPDKSDLFVGVCVGRESSGCRGRTHHGHDRRQDGRHRAASRRRVPRRRRVGRAAR